LRLINCQLQLQFIDEQCDSAMALHTVAIFVEEAEGLPELLDLLLGQLLLHLVHSSSLDRFNGLLIDLLTPLEKPHDRWTTRFVPSITNSQATMDAD